MKVLKQTGAALGGAIVGLGAGVFTAKKMLTPPGAKEIAEEQKNLEKENKLQKTLLSSCLLHSDW